MYGHKKCISRFIVWFYQKRQKRCSTWYCVGTNWTWLHVVYEFLNIEYVQISTRSTRTVSFPHQKNTSHSDCFYRIRTHNLTLDEKFMKLMDTNFRGAFLTTEAAVSYYNKRHIKNNQIVVRPTSDRVLLMVIIK